MISYLEFAKQIKEKYPQYADVDDLKLAQAMVEKYPEYAQQVEFGATFDSNSDEPIEKSPLSIAERVKMGFGDVEGNLKYLQNKYGKDNVRMADSGTSYLIKTDKGWQKSDPQGMNIKNITDLPADVLEILLPMGIDAAAQAGGVTVGGLTGNVPGAVAGAAGGAAVGNAINQGIGNAFGVRDGFNAGEDILSAVLGGAFSVIPMPKSSPVQLVKKGLNKTVNGIKNTTNSIKNFVSDKFAPDYNFGDDKVTALFEKMTDGFTPEQKKVAFEEFKNTLKNEYLNSDSGMKNLQSLIDETFAPKTTKMQANTATSPNLKEDINSLYEKIIDAKKEPAKYFDALADKIANFDFNKKLDSAIDNVERFWKKSTINLTDRQKRNILNNISRSAARIDMDTIEQIIKPNSKALDMNKEESQEALNNLYNYIQRAYKQVKDKRTQDIENVIKKYDMKPDPTKKGEWLPLAREEKKTIPTQQLQDIIDWTLWGGADNTARDASNLSLSKYGVAEKASKNLKSLFENQPENITVKELDELIKRVDDNIKYDAVVSGNQENINNYYKNIRHAYNNYLREMAPDLAKAKDAYAKLEQLEAAPGVRQIIDPNYRIVENEAEKNALNQGKESKMSAFKNKGRAITQGSEKENIEKLEKILLSENYKPFKAELADINAAQELNKTFTTGTANVQQTVRDVIGEPTFRKLRDRNINNLIKSARSQENKAKFLKDNNIAQDVTNENVDKLYKDWAKSQGLDSYVNQVENKVDFAKLTDALNPKKRIVTPIQKAYQSVLYALTPRKILTGGVEFNEGVDR